MGNICGGGGSDPKKPPSRQSSTKSAKGKDGSSASGHHGNVPAPKRNNSTFHNKSKCPHCSEWLPNEQINTHANNCPERKVSCQHTWCSAVVRQKELEDHMIKCAQSRSTRCAKCGDVVNYMEVQQHRAQCVTVACPHCSEEVIPRILKYCPHQLFRNVRYTKGPFALEFLRDRFIKGITTPNTSLSAPGSPAGPAGRSPIHPHPTMPARSESFADFPTTGAAAAVADPDIREKFINFNVARVQHLWRWARARVLVEDLLFKLIYKEIDTKKESFSIFKSRDRFFDVDDESCQITVGRRNVATSAPVMTQNAQAGHYFPSSNKVPITPEICDLVLNDMTTGTAIPYYAVYRVFNETADALKRYPNIAVVPALDGARYINGRWVQGGRCNVIGDLHGQLSDLLHILEQNGKPHEGNIYVFNGDFVDRGSKGFEVFFTLCMLFLAYPGNVFLNRGNHECDYMNEEYGFDVEVQTKYDRNVFKLIQRCFNNLPMATLIGKKVFVVHAGVPRTPDITIDDINEIIRFREIPLPEYNQPEEDEIFQDMMWSDPMEKKGWVNSERGVGVLYGPDISEAFMKNNGLSLIIRSHETFMRGYEEHHGGRVVTVFSCSNYDGPNTNFGSFIVLLGDSAEPSFHTYQVTPDEFETMPTDNEEAFAMTRTYTASAIGGGGNSSINSLLGNVFWFTGLLHNRSARSARDDVLRMIRESLFERRHKLLAYFSKIDRTRKGTVWKMEWTEAMRNVLNLELPWFFLRPYLCETDPGTQRVNYVRFLRRFRTPVSRAYMEDWEINALAELHSMSKLRKNQEAIRHLLSSPVVNYNTFCSVFKKVDYNLSDNALFELFMSFDEDNSGVISGGDYLQLLETAADNVEARHAGDPDAGGELMAWDIDAMNQMEHILYTSRTSLHTLYKLPTKDASLDRTTFIEGTKHLVRAVKKLNAITNENIDVLWDWLARENNRDQLSIDELFLCFLVRDFVLVEDRLTWFGDDPGDAISPFYTLAWLVQPQTPQYGSGGAVGGGGSNSDRVAAVDDEEGARSQNPPHQFENTNSGPSETPSRPNNNNNNNNSGNLASSSSLNNTFAGHSSHQVGGNNHHHHNHQNHHHNANNNQNHHSTGHHHHSRKGSSSPDDLSRSASANNNTNSGGGHGRRR